MARHAFTFWVSLDGCFAYEINHSKIGWHQGDEVAENEEVNPRVSPPSVRPSSPLATATPVTEAASPAPTPIDRVGRAPPTIPTRMSASPSAPLTPARRFTLAVDAAAARGRPVHVGSGMHVTSAIASVLCFPGDFLHVERVIFDRLSAGMTGLISSEWNKGGGHAVLAVLLGILLGPAIALLSVASVLSRLASAPFDLLRMGLNAIGRATTREQAESDALANFRRIAARDWPRMPENADADAAVERYVLGQGEFANRRYETDLLIVPGYATAGFTGPLHPRAAERAEQAARDFFAGRAPFILVSGGNVHPQGTPYNEATELKRYLVETLHVPADRVILEPLAAHSPTNVRNAGRYMIANGLRTAQIVSDADIFGQTVMFAAPDSPFFGVGFRALWSNGVSFGDFRAIDPSHTGYAPSNDVMLARVPSDDP